MRKGAHDGITPPPAGLDGPAGGGGGGKRGNPAFLAAALLLALASVAFIAYPYVSNWLNQIALSRVSYEQAAAVEQAPAEELDAMWDQALAYNADLASSGAGGLGDPYAGTEGTPRYRQLLDLAGDSVMGSIAIPKANVRIPIYHGVSDETLARGVGHLPGTSLPVGGIPSHAVLTGHTGLPSARYFDDIDKLEAGDWFVIEVLGRTLAYRVYRVDTVLPNETGSLAIQEGKDLVTLVTCTPYGVNTHRLLVHAERIDVPREWYDMLADGTGPPRMLAPSVTTPIWLYALAGVAVGIVAALAGLALRSRRRRRGLPADAQADPGE